MRAFTSFYTGSIVIDFGEKYILESISNSVIFVIVVDGDQQLLAVLVNLILVVEI